MRAAESLHVLYTEIDARCRAAVADAPHWPCRRGCDLCCRRLASLPELTAAEWEYLDDGLRKLGSGERDRIARRLNELAASSRPFVCPFLDPGEGVCLVYSHRPAACRTYGFYVERDRGLFCGQIEELAGSGGLPQVIWGNHAGVEARLAAFGARRSLVSWYRDTHIHHR